MSAPRSAGAVDVRMGWREVAGTRRSGRMREYARRADEAAPHVDEPATHGYATTRGSR